MSNSALAGPTGLVWDQWRKHAEETPDREAIVHWTVAEPPFRWRWGELIGAASRLSRRLAEAGVRPGNVCAVIVRHHWHFYPLYLAVSALGALPAVLAYPNSRLHPEKFRQGLIGMSRRSGLDFVLTERSLAEVISPLTASEGSTIREVLFPLEWCENLPPSEGYASHPAAEPEAPVLLQHSSGTTGLQKPVVLSHRAVLEHIRRYAEALHVAATDKVVSWLPLYHDMGLIAAFYLPLTFGIPLIQLDPFEWVTAPGQLLEAASKENATLAWLPNFAYNLMADRIRDEQLAGIRLDGIRMLINCSEPVRARSHERLLARLGPYGLRQEALAACYAMAETTFAVTQTTPGQEARILNVSRSELGSGRVQPPQSETDVRACVSSGAPISGCELRIVDEKRQDVPAGRVGEIAVSSVSLFDGYRNYPEKTREVLDDGWYFTGDYGFIEDGDCFVVGRRKDTIIVAGNNVFPEDVEDVLERVEGIIPGRVVAFGVEDEAAGTDVLCVVAETNAEVEIEKKKLRMAILIAGLSIDVTISRVYLVPPRWLIKSSSGKPSRSNNKQRALDELVAVGAKR